MFTTTANQTIQSVLSSSKLSVSINHLGAEVCSIKDNNQTEFIWQADSEWKRHSPVLFPIVGKLKNDEYILQNKKYKLTQHGFARDKKFSLLISNDNHCVFELQSSVETKQNYPFDFIFQISYTLIENILAINYKVINPSPQQLFFSVGAHPAFNCSFSDYFLEFEKSDFLITQLKNGLRKDTKKKLVVVNNKINLSKKLFENDALVFENFQVQKISLCSKSNNQKISLQSNNFPYFGIWSAKNCDKFICLEPWFGVADKENSDGDFQKKEGCISLGANDIFSCDYSITIHS